MVGFQCNNDKLRENHEHKLTNKEKPHPKNRTNMNTTKNREGPKGVSTKGVSMKRPQFPNFRGFCTAVSKRHFQKLP